MLVSTTDGFAQLSSIKAAPSQINATSAVLVPTSYTGEVLAPAMKKYVAVTAAFDKDGNSVESVASVPIAICYSIAVAVLPTISRYHANKDVKNIINKYFFSNKWLSICWYG